MTSADPLAALADNYIWMARDASGTTAFAVDPGDAAVVEAWLHDHQLRLAAVLVTHHHGDHTGGVAELAERHRVPVFGPATETIPTVDHPITGGEHFSLEGFGEFRVLDCPGHTAGHIAYLWEGHLFSGDALFAGGCGRVFEGTAGQMHASLQHLAALPADTRVCCGHEYTVKNLEFAHCADPKNDRLAQRLQAARDARAAGQPTVPSTLAEELATNPFLRTDCPELRRAAQDWCGRDLDQAYEVFATLRRWKDTT
ncbi:hydroxyacylglutathione hydrolase [Halorhodospira halophila]|uniref:Hydroxyacylglutathione hydrolase n=1 Tax=Halorhodospira halophila (strain DSM 244 / SL1) TaxID=349124 RepID=GLO2_HALHL|nr:hydroxyacylglutathione hydrolase [Halorhodospira halophila]A1WXD9.1 RecName: Full=Hydroxyacylglutathione hydrolase; AltName: Full=Glyoxalase II; Short=Glx II [Halorhodospira halophila SL1]ABM62351.1 Hydroxyacylglutathione hydrolase [Halorhodospira halophila SL1]MBK1730106.1 hydroxyacylglutathione hydrolase [Halorhodospira halophila]